MAAPGFLVGIDVGGTFTDVVAYAGDGRALALAKVPSLPGEQWRGVLEALSALGIAPTAIRAFVHGTTIATNALLERKGARTALVTTAGFRDVLEIGKCRRLAGGLFDAAWQRPPPIAPRDRRLEVAERTAADGTVLEVLDPAALASLAETLSARGAEAIAVAFVNSYVNAGNELAAAAALREALPGIPVSTSAALAPERGEFERTSTCVLNAYLTPVMTAYLTRLADALAERGVVAPVDIMGSNGGAMTLDAAAERCAGTFLSGPVGGVVGALRVAGDAGVRDLVTFDMGGTSTDVALIHDGRPRMSHDNQIDAYPLQMPQLDIHTIGAGGGSIVWVQPDGTLGVGPRSAGAVPGPACYGRGGTEPTVSDANLLLGRLPTARALSGGLVLQRERAERAFATLGRNLGVTDVVALADAAVRIAVAKMAGAVREVSVHRGFDPRDFALVGFGGAGPMHAFLVAAELGMSRVLVPPHPGHVSALGQMLADMRRDLVEVWGGRLSQLDLGDLRARADRLRARGGDLLRADGIAPERHRFAFSVDARYAGQSFTLPITWEPTDVDWTPLRRAFDARHEETFGYADATNDLEIVNLRLVATGLVDQPVLDLAPHGAGDPRIERRAVWLDGWREVDVLDREKLGIGTALDGPLIVEEAGGTTVVPPGWTVEVHASGALLCASG
ncbi:MAG: hydantoinase/oxoprolinase family protein [Planctomycetes bacterium]|nr:hydantoinase/oxoprolinase family protein [Planctomycetota bacterium]